MKTLELIAIRLENASSKTVTKMIISWLQTRVKMNDGYRAYFVNMHAWIEYAYLFYSVCFLLTDEKLKKFDVANVTKIDL